MKTTESSSGDSGRKPPASLRQGDPGATAATSIITASPIVTASATQNAPFSRGSSSARSGSALDCRADAVSSSSLFSASSSVGTCSVGAFSRFSRGSTILSMMNPATRAKTMLDTRLNQ